MFRNTSPWRKKIVTAFTLLLAFGILAGTVTVIYIIKDLPQTVEISSRRIVESAKILDRTGKVVLYEIHGEENRTFIPMEDIPDHMKYATVAIEDDAFYSHPAFDLKGIVRAVFKDITTGSLSQGGSTITQQLAKNAFLSNEKTFTRKIKELVLAWRLEQRYTKDEILHFYLNQIPYGGNAYGVEAAAQTYFTKPAKELTLNEAALLASLPQATSYYSPWGNHVDELKARKDRVLVRMNELGYISDEELEANKGVYPDVAPRSAGSIKAPHFVMYVTEYLTEKYGEDFLETSGLRITTTLDWQMQQIAEKAVADGVARNTELYAGRNGALTAIDPQTGQVLAMVGSADYFNVENEGNFNVATQGLRQPGSTFKPFAYVTAFEKGLTPDTLVWDVPTEFDTTGDPQYSYRPQNFDGDFSGLMSLKSALAQSRNIPAVKTLYYAGLDETLDTARSFGITTLGSKDRYGLSLVLGGGEVTLLDLVRAYGVFAAEGVRHDTSIVLSIETKEGEVLETYKDVSEQVIDPQYPRLINDILSDPELRRPLYGSSFNLTMVPGHQVAMKTGTTNDYVDAWTVGYTPNLVVGVWAGNNHREPLQKKGGSVLAAVPMWHAFIAEALKDKPLTTFTRPDPIATDNPVLRGELPQGEAPHSLLYYLGRVNDPQFPNWEAGVSAWLGSNTFDPSAFATSSTGGGAVSNGENATSSVKVSLKNPGNGVFIEEGKDIQVNAVFTSTLPLQKIEVYLNGALIDSLSNINATSFQYVKNIRPSSLELQNTIEVRGVDTTGFKGSTNIIIYRSNSR